MSFPLALLFGAVLLPLLLSLVGRDIYACLPWLQQKLIRFAARLLASEMRAAAVEQWSADINDLLPSELTRTWVALDIIRAALVLRWRQVVTRYSAVWHLYRMMVRLEQTHRRNQITLARVYKISKTKEEGPELARLLEKAIEVGNSMKDTDQELLDARRGLSSLHKKTIDRTIYWLAHFFQ